ncbi:sugar phosphate isomerase/epimerase family protein [Paludicola sp. MB14-C6]|uniref:sugar phosphate isomerase/epimerase family protein n=1 Tax=Paludihabitans sp. MB14-C6 TaxID=3070656 RepID=UPI0027DB208D|nr:sugar phosphate isomerase/epimerase family protein [Paludicola sp. MB14-C6]WMJ23508.1 sugar phosphate isomerase/epimerase family protein [Paludicola sp. MB14-C6]
MTKMRLGVIIHNCKNGKEGLLEKKFKDAHEMGFETCQFSSWDMSLRTQDQVDIIKKLSKKYHVEITAIIGGWTGPSAWNFYEGQLTLGIVPSAYRHIRMNELLGAIDFASALGVSDVNTHLGFIPENPNEQNYKEVVAAVKHIANYAKNKNINFVFETGQETPITLLRLIQDVGFDNIGINLDPANLVMYGKANPCDALDIIGNYVKGVHGKDGKYPTDPYALGNEAPIGDGVVNFPLFIEKLHKCGYQGAITIEREIQEGEQQIADIKKAQSMLQEIINRL